MMILYAHFLGLILMIPSDGCDLLVHRIHGGHDGVRISLITRTAFRVDLGLGLCNGFPAKIPDDFARVNIPQCHLVLGMRGHIILAYLSRFNVRIGKFFLCFLLEFFRCNVITSFV